MRMYKTKFVERAGTKLFDTLCTKDPFYELGGGCKRDSCHICRTQCGKGINCRTEGVTYSIQCKRCSEEEEGRKTVYIGETGRSAFERMREHFHNFNNKLEPKLKTNSDDIEEDKDDKDKGSAMWLHSKHEHKGTLGNNDWIAKITSTHRGALNRQVTEGIRISNEGVENLLNSKNEFGANNFTEIILTHGHKILGDNKHRKRGRVEERNDLEDKNENIINKNEETDKSESQQAPPPHKKRKLITQTKI